MRVYQIVLFTILAGTLLPVALHRRAHGAFDIDEIGIAFFLWINVIIALWEICLWLRIDHIAERYKKYREEYKGRELARVIDFGLMRVPLAKLFSPTLWSELWSSYSVFDESYADKRSYGFFIDIGNGFSLLIPTLLCIYGMTFEFMSARVFGIVLLIINYQMWYGTLLYFTSFLVNKRHRNHTRVNLVLFVGLTNGLWFTFPLWGIYAALKLIHSDSYAIFR